MAFSFHLHHTDATTAARRATFNTPHGAVEMPAFMPVGTLASVKGLEIEQLRGTGAQMVLANTYHLALRPGELVVAELGGLHAFMGWDGPILTDSGGFQIFSLAHLSKISEQEAIFRSHIDGRLLAISPERAVAIQEALGSDVAMVLDHVVQLPNEPEVVRDACAIDPLGRPLPRCGPPRRPGPVRHRARRPRHRPAREVRRGTLQARLPGLCRRRAKRGRGPL